MTLKHLNDISANALHQAVKRMTVIPIIDGEIRLSVQVKYTRPNAPAGESAWSDTPAGDEYGRLLLNVVAGNGVVVDSFRAYEHSNEVRPCSDAPPVWWA